MDQKWCKISFMENDFVEWIQSELNNRGWNNRELAKRSGLKDSTISMTLNRQNRVSFDFCLGIAKAFRMLPEQTLRQAGLLPPVSSVSDDALVQKIIELIKQLPASEKKLLLELAEWRYQKSLANDEKNSAG